MFVADVFFGLEAATDQGLTDLVKDTTIDRTVEAVGVAREYGDGVTGIRLTVPPRTSPR